MTWHIHAPCGHILETHRCEKAARISFRWWHRHLPGCTLVQVEESPIVQVRP